MDSIHTYCDLHELLTNKRFHSLIHVDKFQEFCKFIQDNRGWHIKRRYAQNPNNIDAHMYIFRGTGSKYLSQVADQFITFQLKKENNPVISTKLIQQTKSLAYLGKASFAISLLLLISYYEAYLSSTSYSLNAHMTEDLEISSLLFMMQNSNNQHLHNMVSSMFKHDIMLSYQPTHTNFKNRQS